MLPPSFLAIVDRALHVTIWVPHGEHGNPMTQNTKYKICAYMSSPQFAIMFYQ
jgi:hypothetical protein